MRSKEEIDYTNQLRKDAGQEPLPYEVEEVKKDEPTEDKPEIKAEEIKPEEKKDIPTPVKAELTDEEKEAIALAVLEKRGKKVASLDELINPKKDFTPEEIQQQKEQEEANKVAYFLNKGLVSKKTYDNYVSDLSNIQELVYADFAKDEKEADPNLTEAEIREKFDIEFGIDANENSILFKRGKKKLEVLAEKMISEKYKSISEAENKYSEHIASEKEESEYQNTIKAKAPQYKKDVDEAIGSINKIKVPFGDKKITEIEVSPDVIEGIRKEYEKSEVAESRISENYTKERIQKEVEALAIMRDLPNLLKKYAESELLKHQAGLRGVVPAKTGEERAKESKVQPNEGGFDPYAYTGTARPREN